jgi:dihydrofolate reductase
VAGGARTVNQFLELGLIDRLRLHVTAHILGAGERVFDGVSARPLERLDVRVASTVTHITYGPVRS